MRLGTVCKFFVIWKLSRRVLKSGTRIMNFSFPTKWSAGRRAGAHPSVGHGDASRRRVLPYLVAAFLTASFFLLHFGNCEAQSPTEYQVKAAYLFNLIRFVEWPDASPAETPSKWTIGVVGTSPVGDELTKLVESKSILGRELQVKTFQATDDLRVCNILFISESEKKRLPSILAGLRGSSVMTVADMEHFIDTGGMVQFVMDDARVRISIDVGATGRARLKVSSKLLALARAVTADGTARN